MKRSPRLAIALLVLAGCTAPRTPAPTDDYPGVLHPPRELSPDMVVEQHIEATRGDQHGGFDVVLQKRGAELTLVGLGPLGIRAFVLRQEGDQASLERTMGPPLPFPPRNVLVDVHRAFFERLPAGVRQGTLVGTLDGEEVTEIWDGELRERRFVRAGRPGAVRVIYGPGCRPERCEPTTIRIVNEWFGYTLDIENHRYTFL